MKVVLINHSDSLGGASVVTYRLLKALQAQGVEARMLVVHKATDDPSVVVAAPRWRARLPFYIEAAKIFAANGHDRGDLFKVSLGSDGLPLIQSVLGEDAMLVAVLALAVFNVATWTHGVGLIGGRAHLSPQKVILNPGVLGFAAGLLLFLTGWRLPGPVDAAVGYLGSLNTPLAMVIIGGQMAQTNFGAAFRDKALYLLSALKLLGIPLLTALVLLPFHLDPVAFTALVILSACPTAGATSLFSQSMGGDTDLAARQITLSTLLCVVTLPLMAVLAQTLAG